MNVSSLLRPIDVRRHNRAAILRLTAQYARPGGTVYDIGCGDKPFAPTVRALGCTHIGVDIAEGQQPQLLVPGGVWQAAEPAADDAVLVTCIVSPGFDYADFRLL